MGETGGAQVFVVKKMMLYGVKIACFFPRGDFFNPLVVKVLSALFL